MSLLSGRLVLLADLAKDAVFGAANWRLVPKDGRYMKEQAIAYFEQGHYQGLEGAGLSLWCWQLSNLYLCGQEPDGLEQTVAKTPIS